jgi:hypothetical protein
MKINVIMSLHVICVTAEKTNLITEGQSFMCHMNMDAIGLEIYFTTFATNFLVHQRDVG